MVMMTSEKDEEPRAKIAGPTLRSCEFFTWVSLSEAVTFFRSCVSLSPLEADFLQTAESFRCVVRAASYCGRAMASSVSPSVLPVLPHLALRSVLDSLDAP